MSDSNKAILTIASLLLLLASCLPPKRLRDFNEQSIKQSTFFTDIPELAEKHFDRVVIYRTTFGEGYVENRSALDFALLNDSGRKGVSYLKMYGDTQQIYLISLQKKGDTASTFIYLPVKYSPGFGCVGIGPAYLGTYGTLQDVITFTSLVNVKKTNGEYRLGKTSTAKELIFVPAEEITPATQQIRIAKLVLGNENKIAGKRPAVLNVAELMKPIGLQYLYFDKIHTYKLN